MTRRRSVFCCSQPLSRPGSPDPPARPISTGIDSILAASCLPDNHPHSIHFPAKKPSTDFSIVRSPSFTEKIKGQLRSRPSTSSLHSMTKSTKATRVDSHHNLPVLQEDPVDVKSSARKPSTDKTRFERAQPIPDVDGAFDPRHPWLDSTTSDEPELLKKDAVEESHSPVELLETPRRIPRLHEMRISQMLRPLSEQTDRSAALSPCPSSVYSRQPSRAEAIDGSTDENILGDYERRLTVAGDDRRRRSNINLRNLQDIQQDDSRLRNSLKHRISRAKPLLDDGGGLMVEALAAHQEEKAMFRSASKQRESLGHGLQYTAAAEAPVFATSIFSAEEHATSFGGSEAQDEPEPTKPLDSLFLNVPEGGDEPEDSTSLKLRSSPHRRASSAVAPTATVSMRPPKRIGTWLASWTRFPSHTRRERCGSADSRDDVLVHDFGMMCPPVDEGVVKRTKSGAKLPGKLATIWRYYAEVLTMGTVQNRRTSVSTGGWLEQPDLELLPPRLEDLGGPVSQDGSVPGHVGRVVLPNGDGRGERKDRKEEDKV